MRIIVFFFSLVLLPTCAISQEATTSVQEDIKKLIDSSNAYYNAGNYSKSLELNVKIVEQAIRINDTSYLQKGYRYLGYDYLLLGDTIQARTSFEKSQRFASFSKDKKALGQSYMDLANLYGTSSEMLDKALTYHNLSITTFKKLKDTISLGSAYYNTIVNLQEAKKFLESRPYLTEIDKIKYSLNNSLRAGIQNQWARYYFHNNDLKKTDYYLSEIIQDTLLHTSKVELADGYELYSKSLYSQERYKEAYDNAILFQNLFEENLDKVQNEESQKIAANFQIAQYKKDIERTELQNQLQAEMVKSQSNWNKFLIVVTCSSILLLMLLYRTVSSRKEYIRTLKIKNKQYLAAKNESEESSKAKTDFFSTVSHELRTPLYGVIGLSSILMDDPKLISHEKELTSLKFSADYLLALINDVLQINKIDSNNIKENLEYFNIREFIKSIVSSFEYMRLQNGNQIHINIDKNIPEIIKGDTTRISQILMNLVGNACKFTENGDIYITLETGVIKNNQANIRFTIKDTGIGIPIEKQLSIFDEFSQVSSKHYTYQGTGLGLPIVKKLLALSDTTIHLSSEEGKGSTFYFTLNFSLSPEKIITKPHILVDDEFLKEKRILIVDDNKINQVVTTKILQKNEVLCSVANNGQEAVDLARNKQFDLILMDINMPVKDGLEATQEIRLFDQKIPIIALTAVEVREMRYKIYNAGLSDIIVKPYDITLFKQTILRNLMNSGSSDVVNQIRLQA